MKPIRGLLSLIVIVAVLLASAVSASAIGFEAEAAYESVFVIFSGNSMGSGFAIGNNCIVTNAHVIEDKRQVSVITYGGAEFQATVVGIDSGEDIAVLIVRDESFPYLTIADLSKMKTGDAIYTIGAPKGMAYSLTTGGISAKERIVGRRSYIQIDAPINEGNSGGPLLNDAGEVLGMNTLKMTDSEGIGLAIPITRICSYLDTLGIEQNKNGNVLEKIDVPEETPSPPIDSTNNDEEETEYNHNDQLPTVAIVAFVIAGLSLSANVVLAILLIYQKRRNITLPYDPRERTDFDIDIWE